MAETKIRVHLRIAKFWEQLRKTPLATFPNIAHALGWFATFIVLAINIDTDFNLVIFFLFLHSYFFFKFIQLIHTKLKPPVELLLLLFWLIFLFELLLLEVAGVFDFDLNEAAHPPAFLFALQYIFLALLVLLFSLILTANSRGKKTAIVIYFLLGLFTADFIVSNNQYYYLFLEILIFLLLLRKTSWLENLTKTECWLYLFFLFIIFRQFANPNPFSGVGAPDASLRTAWFVVPYYLHTLFKLYLIALLVKIPVVLVYNHARLSRKLWISGLFQSTFPQMIQLIMLLLIFHFFIAGWQAENVRQALLTQIDEMKSGQELEALDYLNYQRFAVGERNNLAGYQPFVFRASTPDQGVLVLERSGEKRFADESGEGFFLFFRPEEAPEDSVFMIAMTPQLLQLVSNNTHVLAGSALLSYPYMPNPWESFLYTPTFLSEDGGVRLFPYAVAPKNSGEAITARIENRHAGSFNTENWEFDLFNGRRLTLGRILMPLYDARLTEHGYYVFDVLLEPDISFFLSPIARNIASLFVLYLLINFLVTRRVVKFGSEINHMIVQKFNQLKNGISQVAAGNLDYKVHVEGQDEFVELGEHFNRMGDKLKETIDEVREKDRLEHELHIARQVQLSLLPPHLPEVEGFQVAATLKTATEVGGDFYDITPLGDGKFLFTIGDVSGKSTSAAFYMAQCISLIRFSPQFTDDPREITLRLNQYFADPLVDRQMFVTAIVGMLDAGASTIRYVRAGHMLPIFIPGDKEQPVRELQATGLGIGLARSGEMLDKLLQLDQIRMQSGDTVLLYTDGVIEATRRQTQAGESAEGEIEFFGENRLQELIEASRGQSALDILQTVCRDLEAFYENAPPADDYTLLVIRKI